MNTNKRYHIFVSSTFHDLREERAAVEKTLLELEAFPAGMELFGAADDDAWTLIEEIIADCDYYLLIVGGKYGSIDEQTGLSYTEREYDTAVRLGKPVMAFLCQDPDKLPAERVEIEEDSRKKLAGFRKKVKEAKHVKYWSSAAELASQVATSWFGFLKRYPATGWVKDDQIAGHQDAVIALAKAQAEVRELKNQLDKARTEAPSGTEDLAQGEDPLTLKVTGGGTYLYQDLQPSLDLYESPLTQRVPLETSVEVELTWDQVFSPLGLVLLGETGEQSMRDALCDAIKVDQGEILNKALVREFSIMAPVIMGYDDIGIGERQHISQYQASREASVTSVLVPDEDYRAIILQLDALGLIAQSERVRSVGGRRSVWTLTPYGHTRLVQIRAQHRTRGIGEAEPLKTKEA